MAQLKSTAEDRDANDVAGRRMSRLLPALGLLLITAAAYWPVLQCGFIWDDDFYVINNEALRSVEGLVRIWTDPFATPQYYPLVHSTFWLEYQLWGLNPAGYHAVNVLLHGTNAVLFWLVLRRLAIPGAYFAAAIFALHPVHVESVAWVTERKNVLSLACYLAALLVWLNSAPAETGRDGKPWNRRAYGLVALLFLMALLSKTVTCSLPAVMLILAWWQRGRITRDEVVATLPLFCLGLVLGLLTAFLEKHQVGASGDDWNFSIGDRFLIAGRAVWFYAGKLHWPTNLAFIYPYWNLDTSSPRQWLYPLTAAGLVALLWKLRGRLGRGPIAAVLFFGGTLLPALGFVDVFPMRYSFVADHFQYVASLGLIALETAMVTLLLRRCGVPGLRAGVVAGLALLAIIASLTWRQTHIYRDLPTLWNDTLAKNPDCWMAHNNLGVYLLQHDAVSEAKAHFERQLELRPNDAVSHNNIGQCLLVMKQTDLAATHFRRALELEPVYADAHYHLGNIQLHFGHVSDALAHFKIAQTIRPQHAEICDAYGMALLQSGHPRQAIAQFEAALEFSPEKPVGLGSLAWVLATYPDDKIRDGAKAVAYAERAEQLAGGTDPQAAYVLSAAYAEVGRFPEAIAAAKRGLELAVSQKNAELAESIRTALKLYEAGKPFRDG
ncbi:MAG: O-GlcNAc transferase [Pirellula sp.]|nr:O-GlcNAc transferase [Pirellula sp.]